MQGTLNLRERLLVLVLLATAPVAAVSTWAIFALGGELPERRVAQLLALLALSLAAGLAGAWWFGRRFLVKPTKQILGAVRRVEQGRLDARVPLVERGARGEFARIATAFNLMAESLEQRQVDLQAELGRSRSAYAVLDTVLNGMQEGVLAVDDAGGVLMFNRTAGHLFPVDGPPVAPADWPARFGFYQPGTDTFYAAEATPLARAMRGENGELLVQVRNALVPQGRLLRCTFRPLHDDRHGVVGGLVVFTDVTALERAEAHLLQQLREFSGMLQRTAEAAQAITRHQALERTLEEVVAQVRRVIGAHHASLRLAPASANDVPHAARSASDRYPGDAAPAPQVGRLVVPLVDGRDETIGELALADKYHGAFTERDEYVAIELAQLASIAIENARLFEQIRDLNASLEGRIAERTAELVRQGRLYRTLAEQAPEVVWNTNARGTRLTFLNRAWYDLVGGGEKDWIGTNGLSAVHPEDRDEVMANWRRAREAPTTFTGIRRIRARDGRFHTMSYKGAPVFDEDGQVAFWVGIDSDITELKAIEEALRATNQELEAFSYSVSHDLRAPLGAIDGSSRALASRIEGLVDDKARHYLSRIQAGVGKMEQLIDGLLSLSRVAREPLHDGPIDLSAMARDTLDGLHAADPGRVVSSHVQEGMVVHGDPRLVRALLENLLGNAWKFTSKSPEARIEVGLDADGVYFVRDNGVGFEMAYADKLFSAFQRLHAETEFPGTGIGLATVRRIVSRHHGRVWAVSRPGEGATIHFTLWA